MDNRTKKEKLEAMANQSVSPHEAEVARQKLIKLVTSEFANADKKTTEAFISYKDILNMTNDQLERFSEKLKKQAAADAYYATEIRNDPDGVFVYNFKEEKWE